MATDSVGFLAFDIGVDPQEINDLTKQLESIRKGAEAALNIKADAGITQTLKDANAAAAPLSKTLQTLGKDSKTAGDALANTGKSAATSAAGVARVTKEVTPLQKSILGLKNETAAYRNVIEATDTSNKDAISNFTRLKNESLGLAKGLDVTSKEYKELTGVSAQASRSIKTLSNEQTRLGLSGNVAVANSKNLRAGFVGLQGAIGPLIGIAGIGGVVSGLGNMESAFQEANKTIRTGTGATGDALQGLTDSFKIVASSADDSLGDVASTLADLNTRTGATGEALESLTSTVLDLADATGEDLTGLVKETTRVFGDWGVSTEKQATTLDYLFKVSQNTGISVGKLSENLVKYGAPLRQLGFDFETSAALMGKFEKEGVNTELVFGSLRIALGKLSKAGVTDTGAALAQLTEQIQNAGTAGEANALAIETFGARAGPDMAAAIREGRFEVDDLLVSLESSQETIAGAAKESQTFNERMAEFRNSVAVAAEPLGGVFVTGLEQALGLFQGLPGPAQQAALGIGGLGAATTVLGGSFGVLRAAMLPLFAPPIGLFVLGATVVGGLGIALYNLTRDTEPLPDLLARLNAESTDLKVGMDTAVEGVDALLKATNKEGLQGAVENLSGLLTGEAKDAFVTLAAQAIASGADIDTVTQKILAGFLNAQIELVKLKRDGTAAELVAAQKELIQLQNISGENQLSSIDAQIAAQKAYIATLQQRAAEGDIVAQQDLENNRESLALLEDRARVIRSQGGEFTTDLAEQNAAVGALTNVLDGQNTAIKELEAAKNNPSGFVAEQREQATVVGELTGASKEAKAALADLKTQFDSLDSLDAGGAETLLASLRELKDTYPALKAALNPLIVETRNYLKELDDTAPSTDRTTDSTSSLSESLRTATGEANDFSTSLSRLNINSVAEGAAQSVLDLEALRETIRGTQQELALSQDGGEAWGEVYERVYGAQGRAATEADSLEREFFANRRTRQNEDIAAQEELADAVAYYSREVESSGAALGDQIEQNQLNINVLRDVIDAQSEWNERLAISNKDLPDLTKATEVFSDTLARLNENASSVTSAFEDIDDITGGMENAANEAEALGKNFDETGTEIELTEAKIVSLLERGFEPTSLQVEGLTKKLEGLREEQGNLADAYRDAETENELFNTGLSQAEIRAGVAKDKLQELIDQGLDPQSEAVQEAREEWLYYQEQVDAAANTNALAGFVLGELGKLATDALENVEGLGQGGQIALGGFAGAATAASDALSDGFNGTQDAFGIVSGLIDGITSQLGDDVPSEVRIAGSALSGVFSGAAAGAQFGPWGAVAGGVIGGITGLFKGIGDEQERQKQEQERINEELKETQRILEENYNLSEKTRDISTDQSISLDQAELDRALDTGKISEKEAELVQITIDLKKAGEDYRDTVAGIEDQRRALGEQLAANEITQAEYDRQIADLGTAREEALDVYGYQIDEYLRTAEGLAKELGISNKELYTAILTGNEEILGALSPEERSNLLEGLNAYIQVFGEFPPGMEKAAAELGYTFDPITGAILNGTGEVVSATSTGATTTRQAVASLNQQLVDLFGPAAAEPIRQLILQTYGQQAAALTEGDQTLATTATNTNAGSAALSGIFNELTTIFGDKAGPIIDLINQTYADMGGAVGTSSTTLSTQADSSGVTLSSGFGGIFDSAKNAITTTAPGALSSFTDALSGIRGGLGDEASLLDKNLFTQGKTLAEGNKQLFLEQEIAAGKYGPQAKKALEEQIKAERDALQKALFGGGGFIGFLGSSENTVSGALASFFDKQDSTITTQGRQTVGSINGVTGDIREAMNRLIAASSVGKGSGIAGIAGRVAGGGSGGRGAAGFFAPLNSFVDERALGGMSDGFGGLDTYGLMQETEMRPFGFGTSFAEVEPDNSARGGGSTAGALSGLLASVRRGVEGYKLGVVGSVNSAITTQQKAFSALSRSFERDVQTDTERTLNALRDADRKQQAFIKKYGERKSNASKEEKAAYAANKEALLEFERDTFDLISGRALTGYAIIGRSDGNLTGLLGQILGSKVKLKQGLTEYQQEILDFARTTGLALEQSVSGGISSGLKTAIKSGEALNFQSTLEGLFDTTFDGLFDQLSKQVLAQSLGPLLTDLTADITKGDVSGAARGVEQIADKLPGIFGKLEQILAPLRGTAERLGFNTPANEPTFENLGQSIRLEARSLGSATPDWFSKMGAYFDTFGRGAELIARAGDMNWRAAQSFDKAVKDFTSGAKSYESRNPQKLTKI